MLQAKHQVQNKKGPHTTLRTHQMSSLQHSSLERAIVGTSLGARPKFDVSLVDSCIEIHNAKRDMEGSHAT